jgi:hypothetical protein
MVVVVSMILTVVGVMFMPMIVIFAWFDETDELFAVNAHVEPRLGMAIVKNDAGERRAAELEARGPIGSIAILRDRGQEMLRGLAVDQGIDGDLVGFGSDRTFAMSIQQIHGDRTGRFLVEDLGVVGVAQFDKPAAVRAGFTMLATVLVGVDVAGYRAMRVGGGGERRVTVGTSAKHCQTNRKRDWISRGFHERVSLW